MVYVGNPQHTEDFPPTRVQTPRWYWGVRCECTFLISTGYCCLILFVSFRTFYLNLPQFSDSSFFIIYMVICNIFSPGCDGILFFYFNHHQVSHQYPSQLSPHIITYVRIYPGKNTPISSSCSYYFWCVPIVIFHDNLVVTTKKTLVCKLYWKNILFRWWRVPGYVVSRW